MGAQSGIYYFDGRDVPPRTVDALAEDLAIRGTGKRECIVRPGLAQVYRAFPISAEDHRERQPLPAHSGDVLTWDGRLDNREDLQLRLAATPRDHTDDTDAALAMAYLQQKGIDALADLIGDWSLALWSDREHTITLASDFMGARPLYYHVSHEYVVWSTCLETLVRLLQCKDDIDDRFIAGYLIAGPPPELTPYRPIRSLLPGHYLRVSHAGQRVRRFWNYPPATIRYQHDSSYEEHLRDVFATAVRSRMRVDGPIWAELSGGWDSSAVVCMAHQLLKRGGVQARALRTVSFVSSASKESDETPFIEAVERHCDLTGLRVDVDAYPRDAILTSITPRSTQAATVAATKSMHLAGGTLVLTGRLGDAVMGSLADFSQAMADPLSRGYLIDVVKQARLWSLATKKPAIALLAQAATPLLPLWLQERTARRTLLAKAAMRRRARTADLKSGYCIHPRLARRLDDVYPDYSSMTSVVSAPSKRLLVRTFNQSAANRRFEYLGFEPFIEYSHPYIDRRLIEFVLAIPTLAWCRPGEPRSLMRRAFGGFMPEKIVRRFSKGYAAPAITRSLRTLINETLNRVDELDIVAREYVDAESPYMVRVWVKALDRL